MHIAAADLYTAQRKTAKSNTLPALAYNITAADHQASGCVYLFGKFQFEEQHRRECIHAFRKEVLQVTDKSVPYGVD